MQNRGGGHAERRGALRRLLAERRLATQAEVIAALAEDGFPVTQPAVSRDLRELGARKVEGRYRIGPTEWSRFMGLGALVEALVPAGPNILVIRTAPGGAQRAGHALDNAGWQEIAGTVAGDDTVFVASRSAADQNRLLERLRKALSSESEKVPA